MTLFERDIKTCSVANLNSVEYNYSKIPLGNYH